MSSTESLDSSQSKAVRKKASGSSFYIAMRLMPQDEREAMFAIYAFCRKADDIADDGVGTRSERHERSFTINNTTSENGRSGPRSAEPICA